MGRRGRRQVLQLDDSSSSHQTRRHGYQSQQNEERSHAASNPLLNLVGQYSSDPEDDDEEDEKSDEETVESKQEEVTPSTSVCELQGLQVGIGQRQSDHLAKTEGSNIDFEVASFLAEIESISTEPKQHSGDKEEMLAQSDLDSAVLSEHGPRDYGYVLKSDANVDKEGDQLKKVKQSSSSAYKSMFVKGESEFVKQEEKLAHQDAKLEEDELPEEPLSQWQMVQDETTQYYYYWNTVTNEVTWEIPPDYTQYLLLYKEYEEKLAAIPDSRLKVLKKRREQKRQEKESKHLMTEVSSKNAKHLMTEVSSKNGHLGSTESSQAVTEEALLQRSSKHQKTSHPHKEKKDDVELAPQLSVATSNGERNDIEGENSIQKLITVHGLSAEEADHSATHIVTAVHHEAASLPSSENAKPFAGGVDDTAKVKSQESAFILADETSHFVPVLEEVKDHVVPVSLEANKIDIQEKCATKSESFSQPELVSSANKDMLSGESVDDTKLTQSSAGSEGEKLSISAGPNTLDEDDDFDMDFDDIDDLDRALEKALEKKLEKKKAELQKLEMEHLVESSQAETAALPLSPSVTQNPESSNLPQEPQTDYLAIGAAAKDVDFKDVADTASDSSCGIQVSSKRKAEDSKSEEAEENRKPTEKKARLVAYDAYESDEEEELDKDEKMPEANDTQGQLEEAAGTEPIEGLSVSALLNQPPEVADSKTEVQEKADTALAKLAFLGVTETGLSRLQVIAVQLQTRLKDWQEGGLNSEYFFQRMSEVNATLQQYENSAVPPGWACHWDRSFRRYFYTNTSSGESQWDYPDPASGAVSGSDQTSFVEPLQATGQEDGSKTHTIVKPKTSDSNVAGLKMSAHARLEEEEDLDGVAMSDGENEAGKSNTSSMKIFSSAGHNELSSKSQSFIQSFFPGEPLPPGTELLFGLPPPPPPPLPPEEASIKEDHYICRDESSSDSSLCQDQASEDGSEMKSEELTRDEASMRVEDVTEVKGDQSVISKPPQLRFHGTASALSSGASGGPGDLLLPSSSESSDVFASSQVQNPLPQNYSEAHDVSVEQSDPAPGVKSRIGPERPDSPFIEENAKGLGGPASVSATGDAAGQEKQKKKKKEKTQLGSGGLSLKKKGVSSLVQKWQKVKREVEQEERANEQRQMAIRQQLDEWKKENS